MRLRFALLMILALPALGQVAYIGETGVASIVSTTTGNLSNYTDNGGASVSCNVGDLFVCNSSDRIATGTWVWSDSLGNSWNTLTTGTNTARMTPAWMQCAAGKSGTVTITATFSANTNAKALECVQYRNATASPADKNPATVNDSTSPYDAPSSTTLTQALELVVGLFGCVGRNADAWATSTEDAVYWVGTSNTAASSATAAISVRAVNSTSAVAPEITNTTANRACVTGTATFKFSQTTHHGLLTVGVGE